MENYSAFHTSFDIKKLTSYVLNIRLNPHFLAYTMIDVIRRQCVAVNFLNFEDPSISVFDNLQNTIKNDVYLNKHYKAVNLFLSDNKYTLVPEKIFDKKVAKDYMSQIHEVKPDEEVHFAKCEKSDFYLLYVYPSAMTTFLVNHFPEIRLYHNIKLLLLNGFYHTSVAGQMLGEVIVHKDFFDIVLFKDKKLQLVNTFYYANDNDIVYHIINVLKKAQFDMSKTDLYLNGIILSNSTAVRELRLRVNDIFFNTSPEINFTFQKTPPHLWTSLLLDK